MDGFDDAFGAGAGDDAFAPPPLDDGLGADGEVDPAAEFLAQEQEDLAGLGEDLGLSAPPLASPSNDFIGEPEAVAEPIENGFEVEDHGFGSQFQTEEVESATDLFQSNDVMAQMEAEDAPFDKFAALSMSAAEPECITKWKAEQEARLVTKDADEVQKREELRLQAQQELEDWYKLYEEQLEKTKASNRDEQQEFVAEINNIEAGSEWERVAIHCDFNAKVNKNVKDVSRMRSILLQLKQNPPVRD